MSLLAHLDPSWIQFDEELCRPNTSKCLYWTKLITCWINLVSATRVFALKRKEKLREENSTAVGTLIREIDSMLECMPQIVLFSATFPENVRKFAPRFAPDANEISLRREELSVDSIKQFYMDCKSEEHKYEVLCNLYDLLTVSQSIIFCRVSLHFWITHLQVIYL